MYWNILNSENIRDENDIYLIASMVENAKVKIENNTFEIEFTRNIKD